jgi:quercetin dioxygenase-like cupin family protein
MAEYFEHDTQVWTEIHPGVRFCPLHRYDNGGGAGLFRIRADAVIPEHDHPTGEHGYVIRGSGTFGDRILAQGDAFWMAPGESHAIRASTDLVFFATSLPRSAV